MVWPRSPPTTDPLMTQSLRTDFSASMEREIIDGGVAEGRIETQQFPNLLWLVLLLAIAGVGFLAYLWLTTPWFR